MNQAFVARLERILDRIAEAISARVEQVRQRLGDPLTSVGVGIFVAIGAFLIYSPSPSLWLLRPDRLDDFVKLCVWPLSRDLKFMYLAFRITTPVVAWLIGLRGAQAIVLQYAGNVATFSVVYIALRRRTDSGIAFLTTAALGTTMVAHVSNEWWGYPDSVTNLCIALSMVSRNPLALGVTTVLGTLNDERFLLSIPLVLVWHLADQPFARSFKKSIRPLAGYICGIAVTLTIRVCLERGVIGPGIPPTWPEGIVGGSPWIYVFVGAFFGLRWLWLAPILSVVVLRHSKSFWVAIATAIFLLLGCCALRIQLDFSRSAAVFFPAILIGVKLLFDKYRPSAMRIMVLLLAISLITPQLNVVGTTIEWIRPLPLTLIRVNYYLRHGT